MPIRKGHRAWLRAAIAVALAVTIVDVGGGATDDVTVGTPPGGPGPNGTAPGSVVRSFAPVPSTGLRVRRDYRRASSLAIGVHRAGRYAVLFGYRSQLEVVVNGGNVDEIGDLLAYCTQVGDTMHVVFERPARPRSAGHFQSPRARTTGRPVPAETIGHPMTTPGRRTDGWFTFLRTSARIEAILPGQLTSDER